MHDAARTPLLGPATAAGLLAGSLGCLLLPALPPWPWLASALALGFGGWVADRRRAVAAIALGFGLAGLHAAATLHGQLPPALEHQQATVQGRVVDLPVHEARRTRFLLRVDADAAQPPALRGRLLRLSWHDAFDPVASRPRFHLAAGSHWRMTVKLRAPRGLRNPGGIDGERHALQQRLAAIGYIRAPDTALRLRRAHGLDAWRERMSARIACAVPQGASRFVRALALGDTRFLDDGDWETLRATGLTHLVAISGFHVGLVAGFFALLGAGLWRALPRLGRALPRPQAAAAAALLGAVAYAAVAGFALPTVRTVLMIGVVVVALLARRARRPTDALALAVIALLLVDPLAILGAGFWLSFAGVAWLLWCLPPAAAMPGAAPLLRAFLSAQLVATLGLLPLGVVLFGQASLAGPVANLVAIPWWSLVVVPLSLLGTALDTLHAGWGDGPWRWAAAAFDPSWRLFARMADSPLALWWLPEPRWFALPLALAAAFWWLLPRAVPGKGLALLLWLPLLWPQRHLPRGGEVDVVMLDVGQGLSLVVRTARHALLFDMGPAMLDGYDAGERAVVPALHALGVRRLDVAIASHADNDHAGGLAAVRRRFPPRVVFAPQGSGLAATRPCLAGRGWRWDDVDFRFLHPPLHFPYLGNEAGCVLRIDGAFGSVLLTGDIGEVIEAGLLRAEGEALPATVVQVGHHGSLGSSDAAFIAATAPRLGLVSAGHGNRFGHPHPTVVARWAHHGVPLLGTIDGGAVQVRLGAGGLVASSRRGAQPRLWDAVRRQGRAPQLSYPPD